MSCCTPRSCTELVLNMERTKEKASARGWEWRLMESMFPGGEEKEERRQRGRQSMKRWSVKDMMEASMKEAWRRTTRWEGERKEERSGGEQKM